MRCLVFLLARLSIDRPDGLALGLFTEVLGFRGKPPLVQNMHLYAQVEMDYGQRGLPVDMRVELATLTDDGRRERTVPIHSGTGIVSMPLAQGLPATFDMNHEIRFEFPGYGVYEISLYLDETLAASRRVAVVDAADGPARRS